MTAFSPDEMRRFNSAMTSLALVLSMRPDNATMQAFPLRTSAMLSVLSAMSDSGLGRSARDACLDQGGVIASVDPFVLEAVDELSHHMDPDACRTPPGPFGRRLRQ